MYSLPFFSVFLEGTGCALLAYAAWSFSCLTGQDRRRWLLLAVFGGAMTFCCWLTLGGLVSNHLRATAWLGLSAMAVGVFCLALGSRLSDLRSSWPDRHHLSILVGSLGILVVQAIDKIRWLNGDSNLSSGLHLSGAAFAGLCGFVTWLLFRRQRTVTQTLGPFQHRFVPTALCVVLAGSWVVAEWRIRNTFETIAAGLPGLEAIAECVALPMVMAAVVITAIVLANEMITLRENRPVESRTQLYYVEPVCAMLCGLVMSAGCAELTYEHLNSPLNELQSTGTPNVFSPAWFVFLTGLIFSAASSAFIGYLSKRRLTLMSELKTWSESLMERDAFQRTLLDNLSAGVVVMDAETHLIEDANPSAAAMFGAPLADIIGKQCHNFLCPAMDGACPVTDLGRTVLNQEREMLTSGGKRIPVLKSVKPIVVRGRTKLLETFLDISERKRMEEAVKESEERYSAIVNNSPDVVVIHRGGRIVFVNDAGIAASGYTREQIVGGNVIDFLTPASQRTAMVAMTTRTQGRGVPDYEVEFIIRSGDIRNVMVKTAPIRFEGEPASLVVLIDITSLKETQARLAHKEALEKDLVQLSTEFVNFSVSEIPTVFQKALERIASFCDVERACLYRVDERQETMTRTQQWEASGIVPMPDLQQGLPRRYWPAYLGGMDSQEDLCLCQVSDFPVEWERDRKALEDRKVQTILALPLVHSKALLGYVTFESVHHRKIWGDDDVQILRVMSALLASALYRERTELALQVSNRNLESALARAEEMAGKAEQASRAKSQFIANMSHELRTPLNVILGMSELLSKGMLGPLVTQQLESIASIEESGRHLLSLINDILDLAKIEAGRLHLDLAPVSIQEIGAASLRMVTDQARRKRIKLSSNIGAVVGNIRADGRRLSQILINLLSNAVKFTPEGGSVGLDAEVLEAQGRLRLTVWDTGIGISDEDAKMLFQPFVQVESSQGGLTGTGLGLSLVKRLAELHHGEVTMESTPGVGSRFHVYLPTEKAGAPTGGSASVISPESGLPSVRKGARILVVEDNEANSRLITHYLKPQGCHLLYATDGRQAVETVRREHPDLVLMDVQMPVMDGLEATRRLKQDRETAGIPVVMLTAHAMSGDMERGLEVGAEAYVTKPIELPVLLETIARLIPPC